MSPLPGLGQYRDLVRGFAFSGRKGPARQADLLRRHRMPRLLCLSLLTAFALSFASEPAHAQQAVDAKWVWFDEGNPAENAPAGKVWFRKEYKAEEPSTGAAIVACDDEFVLWVNGQKVGQGGGDKSSFFNLNGIVGRGTNVFAVEAMN